MQWCLGLRGSGSTWVFNAVRQVALSLAPERPLLGPYVVSYADLPRPADDMHLVIVKSHETDEAAAVELTKAASAVWISIRDPRDCVTSLLQHHGLAFDEALRAIGLDARFCARFTTHPNAHLFRYEHGFADDPATLDIIAGGLGGALRGSDRQRIFAETRRSAIEAFISRLDELPTAVRPASGSLVDTVTKWHDHHAKRTGEIGRWHQRLTHSQAAAIEEHLGDWMTAFDYAS